MKRNMEFAAVLMAAVMFPACDKSDAGTPGAGRDAIALVPPSFPGLTKGIDPLQDANLQNFGISAVRDYDEAEENQWYLSEQTVLRGTGENEWEISPTAYWPIEGDLSFFFHAPSNVSHPEIRYIETATGFPEVEFTPSTTDIAGQIDFCMGKPAMHLTAGDGTVPVCLEHALTQIMFYANYTGTLPDGCSLFIDKVEIRNVVGTKKASYSTVAPWFTWEDESSRQADSSYVLERSRMHIRQGSIPESTGVKPDTYVSLSNSPGRLYLLPQTLGTDARLVVEYGFYLANGATLVALFAKEISFPANQVWTGGKTVNYQLTVDVGISSPLSLTCTVSEWEPSGNSHAVYEFE